MENTEIKYLVMDNTNGEGYTSPEIVLLSDRQSALDLYHKFIGVNVTSFFKILEVGFDGNQLYTTFSSVDEDEEDVDHYGCHLMTVKSGQTIVMVCDYANEFIEYADFSADQVIEELGIVTDKGDESEYWVEEDSHEACITHATCQDSGTHYVIIQIK
jgi:hypothetical protein